LELKPDVILGHSTGEYSSLLASGIINAEREEQYIDFVLGVNKVYEDLIKKSEIADGILLSVGAATGDYIKSIVEKSTGPLFIAMENCPNQVVLCGSEKVVAQTEELLRKEGAIVERLPFQRAYHTPLFEAVCAPLLDYFKELDIHRPKIKTYSCVLADPYPDDPHEIRKLATSQWARKVRFIDAIEAMYKEGVRIFVEVGPRGNLTSFVDDILRKREYLAVPSNLHRRSGTTQLNHLVGLLTAHHVKLNTSFLYKYRKAEKLSFDRADRKPQKSDVLESPAKIDLTLPRLKVKGFARMNFEAPPHEEKRTVTPTVKEISVPKNLDRRSAIMMEHLKNMDHFITSQKEVFQTYIKKRGNEPSAPHGNVTGALEKFGQFIKDLESQISPPGARTEVFTPKTPDSGCINKSDIEPHCIPRENVTDDFAGKLAPSAYAVNKWRSLPASTQTNLPFIREIVSFTPKREAVALCTLDVRNDRFLLDHTLGGTVSEVENDLRALSVVPLTFSMEILAEGAALLMPGKKLVGMREIRAYRWIGLDRGSRTLKVSAVLNAKEGGEVKTEIREVDDENNKNSTAGLPILEGTMIFDDDYPALPLATPFALHKQRKSKWTGRDLYDGFMFHGPLLQGVASMDMWGEDGAVATLRAMPANELFSFTSEPNFLIDPVMLDAAGQVIAYWTSDHLKSAYRIFPFKLENLYLYGPPFKEPELARCQARINLADDNLVRSDIDLSDTEGNPRMRVLGWWDRRFDQPENYFQLRVSPREGMISVPWPNNAEVFNMTANVSCCILNGISREFLLSHDRIWMRVMAHLVLSRKEREYWHNLNGTDKRRMEWLLGRTAAKDAVRLFMKRYRGLDLYPADIEIGNEKKWQADNRIYQGAKG
jgi:malonyl CoA-acyl carrier protein transacylase